MAKLHFRYGAMNCGKSTHLLQVRNNYQERGQSVLLLKSSVDTRDTRGMVSSRIGISAACRIIHPGEIISHDEVKGYDCILVDEVQFCDTNQITMLSDFVDLLDIPVICYGLRSDFRGELFPASAKLLAIADSIEEMKTICWCGKKATINARVVDGSVVYTGPQVLVGGNETYIALCRKHWKLGILNKPTQ